MNPEAADELYNGGVRTAASNFAFSSAQKANALSYNTRLLMVKNIMTQEDVMITPMQMMMLLLQHSV